MTSPRLATMLALLLTPLTLTAARADTTILDRDRSDRQAPAQRLVPSEEAKPPRPASPPDVAPFAPFVLRQVQVEGSSLSDREIVRATSRFIGSSLDRQAVDALAKALSDAYAKSDVALYSIFVPKQIGDGVLRIVVIEGVVDEVLVGGEADHADLVFAQQILAPVVNETPLRRSTLERALSLLGAVPGSKAAPQFLKTNKRGVVKLSVPLQTRPLEAGLGIATRGASELGTTQLQADLTANALLRAGDRTTLSFGAPLDFERFRYYGVAHQTPLNADGLTLSGNFGYLTTRPKDIAIEGKAAIAGLQLSYPVLLRFTQALSLGLGFDGLNSDNAFLGESISSDRIRTLRLSASYVEVDDDQSRLSLAAALSQGFNGLGARTTDPFTTDLAFLKIQGIARYDMPLGKMFALRLGATAQYSADKLPAAEQASLGGEFFGRAFDAAIVTGDKSVAGSAELAYLLNELPSPFSRTEVYTFVDGGQVWRTPRNGFGSSSGLASAGFGARMTVFSNVALGLEFAQPLDSPDTDPGNDDPRVIFSFSTRTGG